MKLRISFKEPVWVRLIKLIYLFPVALVLYPFAVMFYGIKHIGNPFRDFSDIFKPPKGKVNHEPRRN